MPDNLARALFESLYEWLERTEEQRIPYYQLQFFSTFIEVSDDLSNANSDSIKKITNLINRILLYKLQETLFPKCFFL